MSFGPSEGREPSAGILLRAEGSPRWVHASASPPDVGLPASAVVLRVFARTFALLAQPMMMPSGRARRRSRERSQILCSTCVRDSVCILPFVLRVALQCQYNARPSAWREHTRAARAAAGSAFVTCVHHRFQLAIAHRHHRASRSLARLPTAATGRGTSFLPPSSRVSGDRGLQRPGLIGFCGARGGEKQYSTRRRRTHSHSHALSRISTYTRACAQDSCAHARTHAIAHARVSHPRLGPAPSRVGRLFGRVGPPAAWRAPSHPVSAPQTPPTHLVDLLRVSAAPLASR